MSHRYSILIDGAFFSRKLHGIINRNPNADDVVEACNKIRYKEILKDYELLRIYYYDAHPATGKLKNPVSGAVLNLGETEVHRRNMAFLQSLELKDDISLRLGETSSNGWRLTRKVMNEKNLSDRQLTSEDFQPNIEQKGVDLRIGLDIARLSLRGLVQTIVVVTGDSDFIPAFKFARREGVRLILCHMGHGVKPDLKAHTDAILDFQ
ncbi:NYN domain-containing protein [Paroceanicella profunda]|uniref:NYN domain-containing protein n=1 Tax=Paroceanicella profunda TaxID=2579971 RepID=A0A5B8FYA4_9RHOB|nr:NYN domain-containing protein [Paroceanicella profunda]QDL91609.1 NYN domain-containing protein [Paroceanicella profunda]